MFDPAAITIQFTPDVSQRNAKHMSHPERVFVHTFLQRAYQCPDHCSAASVVIYDYRACFATVIPAFITPVGVSSGIADLAGYHGLIEGR